MPAAAPLVASSWAASPIGTRCGTRPRCSRVWASRTSARVVSAHRTPD
jgi:hypothetical protein